MSRARGVLISIAWPDAELNCCTTFAASQDPLAEGAEMGAIASQKQVKKYRFGCG